MPRKPRINYTETDKALMWDRWKKGESLESIAQLFDRTHGSVARILRQTGGIRPPKRTRSRRVLSTAEREAQRNIELMWLTERLAPDFKTIADFRKDNGEAIRLVCREFVMLCRGTKPLMEAIRA